MQETKALLSRWRGNLGAVSEKETQKETEQTPEAADAVTEAPEDTTDESADSNILVVYYSAQEHTKGVAEIAADALGADVFVIEPVDIYTEDDLNWRDEQSRVVTEHNDENLHTELVSTTVENWDSYDTVLGRLQSMGSLRVGHDWVTSLSLLTFNALEKEMATHSSVLAWRIPGTGEPSAICGVAQSRTRLKQLSSSSSIDR